MGYIKFVKLFVLHEMSQNAALLKFLCWIFVVFPVTFPVVVSYFSLLLR